jgi:aminopeptidase N
MAGRGRRPRGMTLAFTGNTTAVRRLAGGRRRFVAVSDGPIATDVLQLAVGRLQLVRGPTVERVPLRTYLPPSSVAPSRRTLALLPGQIRTMTRLLGPFPFPRYGVLATPRGGDLEDQTLTLASVAELRMPCITGAILFHELVHEWFGDSVSVARWSDLWLAEGHAVYYQGEYGQPCGTPPVGRSYYEAQDRIVRRELARYGPIAAPRLTAFFNKALAPYGPVAYQGGALAVYALRTRVGQARFQQIERAFVTRYHDRTASTQDYLRTVGQFAGITTQAWFSHWLYHIHPPALPPG